jgi:hypothetical protein
LFIEYIEALSVILEKAYGKMISGIDLNAVNEIKVEAIQQHLSKCKSRYVRQNMHLLEYTFLSVSFYTQLSWF